EWKRTGSGAADPPRSFGSWNAGAAAAAHELRHVVALWRRPAAVRVDRCRHELRPHVVLADAAERDDERRLACGEVNACDLVDHLVPAAADQLVDDEVGALLRQLRPVR